MTKENIMGMRRDAEIAEWQRKSGLKPSEQQELLRRMSDTAFTLIKVIELERSGIRDGDGFWSGSDPMGGIARDLASLIAEYERRVPARDAGRQQFDASGWRPSWACHDDGEQFDDGREPEPCPW
jgi:hypothetical protein